MGLETFDSSQSKAKSFPFNPIFSKIAVECPPAPKVPSTKNSPRFGSSIAITSSKRTGTCGMARCQALPTFPQCRWKRLRFWIYRFSRIFRPRFQFCCTIRRTPPVFSIPRTFSNIPELEFFPVRQIPPLTLPPASEVEFDGQGRILIPEYLRMYAGLKKQAVFAGLYNRIEIWDEKSWKTYKSKTEH